MKLEVHERLALIPLLPTEGTYEALGAIRRAKEMLSFTPEEMTFYKIETTDAGTQWSTAKAAEQVKDVPIEEYITGIIRNKLVDISKKGKLKEPQMSIYDKFVVMYQ